MVNEVDDKKWGKSTIHYTCYQPKVDAHNKKIWGLLRQLSMCRDCEALTSRYDTSNAKLLKDKKSLFVINDFKRCQGFPKLKIKGYDISPMNAWWASKSKWLVC